MIVWYSRVSPVLGTGTSIVVRPPPLCFCLGSSEKMLLAIFALLKIFVAFAGSILGWLAINASSWSSSSVVRLDLNSFQQIRTFRRDCLSAMVVSVIVKGSIIFFASRRSFFSICLLQSYHYIGWIGVFLGY